MARRLEDYVESHLYLTDNTEPCRLYREWVAISCIASALQRRVWLDFGTEVFYPNNIIILVGPPAARKGTAMRPGQRIIRDIGIQLAADQSSLPKLIDTMRRVGSQTTIAGQMYWHSSLTVIASELTVFIGYENKELLQVLCKWYDCEENFEYDTFTHELIKIPHVCMNLIGATTPHLLQTSLRHEAVGGGFTSRAMFVYASDKEKVVYVPTLSEDQKRVGLDMAHDLSSMTLMKGIFKCSEKFMELYSYWRDASESNTFTDQRLQYYADRRPSHLLKTCMAYAASRSEDMVLSETDFARASLLLEETEKKLPNVFVGVGDAVGIRHMRRIVSEIEKTGSAKQAKVYMSLIHEVDRKKYIEILETMASVGVLKIQRDYANEGNSTLTLTGLQPEEIFGV